MEQTLEQEQEQQISKLTKKIERLEKETLTKQATLEQVIPSSLFFMLFYPSSFPHLIFPISFDSFSP